MTNHRVLILFAHPALEKSRVNRRLADAVRALPGVTLHDLYQSYPDFDIDVRHEQGLLEQHDVIVMLHPFYWYSTPALLKEWQDLVLAHGWAYGRGGTALRGKRLLTATTAGGSEAAYCRTGHNRHTIRELLVPIERTAILCGMRYQPPFVVYATHALDDAGIAERAAAFRNTVEVLLRGQGDLDHG